VSVVSVPSSVPIPSSAAWPLLRRLRLTGALAVLALVSVLVGLRVGSVPLSLGMLADALIGAGSPIAVDVFWQLRLPRVLAAFCCGALLAFAGALLQVLLRNPLADPYVLGVSGGAAVGTLAAMTLGLAALAVPAALGGAAAALCLLAAVNAAAGGWSAQRVLLTGVVIATGCGALVSLMLTLAPESSLRGMLFWLLGDLEQARAGLPALLGVAVLAVCGAAIGTSLNALALGTVKARSLGANVGWVQGFALMLAALATVGAVVLGGTLGFVGLVIPHVVRRFGGFDHRFLLPEAMLAGGAFVVLADAAARTVFAPQLLPVGVLTALIGVPFTLWLLARR